MNLSDDAVGGVKEKHGQAHLMVADVVHFEPLHAQGVPGGGMAGELAATLTETVWDYLDGPIVRVTAPDTPVPFSAPLEEAFLPNAEKVIEKARWLYRY